MRTPKLREPEPRDTGNAKQRERIEKLGGLTNVPFVCPSVAMQATESDCQRNHANVAVAYRVLRLVKLPSR